MSDPDRSSTSILERLRGALRRGEETVQTAPPPSAAPKRAEEEGRRRAAARARLRKAAAFEGLRVEDVMVPRADIVALEVDMPLGEVVARFADAAHSRLPVYRDSLDEMLGMAHIKDVMRHLAPGVRNGGDIAEKRVLDAIKRPVLFVPASMPAADLLLKMQSRRIHMAIVVDEFGGADGLVTLEDLVEEIVGDIADEHDDAETPSVRARGPNCWEADARADIEELETLVGRNLEIAETTEEVDTLGGLVFALAGRVPERGEVIRHPAGLEFEVVDADPRRIKRLVARVSEEPPAPPVEGPAK